MLRYAVVCILVVSLHGLVPLRATSLNTYTATVTVTPLPRYAGVTEVQVTGSIPHQMGKTQLGFFGAVFWNPTDDVYWITRVEFNASTAVQDVFKGLEQGINLSAPTSGWVYDTASKRCVYLAAPVLVPPHTAQEFYVRIRPNKQDEAFAVSLRLTANGTIYQRSYATRQQSINTPVSVLWLGSGPDPHFAIAESRSTERTFYVTLQEDSNNVHIDQGGTLTIQVPSQFTDLEDLGGVGWGSAVITGHNIEVANTLAFKGRAVTYAFNASTPVTLGLYLLNASFTGTPDEHPTAHFAVRITG